ncbi:MAG: universal stress protein [Terriglobales bacterium]
MNALTHDRHEPSRDTSSARVFHVETVLVPLDGTSHSKVALPVARVVARVENASLHVVYVGDHLLGARETLHELGLTQDEMHGAVLHERIGEPARAIAELARELPSPLIVMCTHAGNRARTLLGSVAEGVLTAIPARIMFVPPERGPAPWQLRRILLAHNGTPTADVALPSTADLAHRAGAEVIALHVAARGDEGPSEPGSLPAPRYIDQPHHEWPAWAREFVERMMALGAPATSMNFKLLVAGGQPGSEVAQFARDHLVDLVTVPWAGDWDSKPTGALKTIVGRSGCPVLLLCTAALAAQAGETRAA